MKGASPNITPDPIVYSPSQEFIGNDGQWSSFIVRVGTPAQNFQVLPGSKSCEIYVPIVDACQRDNITNCGPLRGAYDFNGRHSGGLLVNSTSTWHEIGLYEMDVRPDLNFTANALYGLDNLGLMLQNSGGPSLSNQTIAALANPAIWVGMMGLGQKPANFSAFDNPQEGLISTLKADNYIPSKGYGYTAGAYYRRPQALASLTLGGYDQSKFVPNNITFGFGPDDDKPLSLNIQSMVARNTFLGSTNLLGDVNPPLYVTIDYTVPHLWLPKSVCDIFASAFHLHYDPTTDLYLVNSTIHTQLQAQNPTLTIGFGGTVDPASRVNIVLPYRAFDLQASHPIYPNAKNYFPIRRAHNDSMYTLGRTFMQEAYLKVDYEKGNFSVHQALFPDSTVEQQIVSFAEEEQGGTRLTAGAIAGIVIGDIAALVLLVLLGLWVFRWRNRRPRNEDPPSEKLHIDGELPNDVRHEKDGPAVFEADGKGIAELHYQSLRVNVNVGRSYELSGYGSTPVKIRISSSDANGFGRAVPMARPSATATVPTTRYSSENSSTVSNPSFTRSMDPEKMQGEVPEARRFSFDSQVSTWI